MLPLTAADSSCPLAADYAMCPPVVSALCDIGLSAGEQQLFALARALVHHDQTKSKVIFVDEATNYVDYECEEKLQDITTEAFQDCTVLTIAHRYHTIQNTTLLELSSGRLVCYG